MHHSRLAKVASTNQGEWAGPCPFCGGRDRFRLWPFEGSTGRWWCRQCGKTGDGIALFMQLNTTNFAEAKAFFGINKASGTLRWRAPSWRTKSSCSHHGHEGPLEGTQEKPDEGKGLPTLISHDLLLMRLDEFQCGSCIQLTIRDNRHYCKESMGFIDTVDFSCPSYLITSDGTANPKTGNGIGISL